MSAFDDVRLPEDIEQGSLIGPMFQTTIVPLSSGAEQRNADWQQEKVTADISYGIMQKENPLDVADSFSNVMRFYRARMGRWRSFRFRDWSDFEAFEEPVTMLNGRYGLLTITYDGYKRVITRPMADTLTMDNDAPFTLLPGGLLDFGADQMVIPKASFLFDIPVRFDTDLAQVNLTLVNAGEIPSIRLVQVPEPYDVALVRGMT